MKYKKAMIAILIAIIVLVSVLIVFLLSYFMGGSGDNVSREYTWEEFEAMTPEQQLEFQNRFKNDKEFEDWLENAQNVEVYVPWEDGGKVPSEYTWEEFEALAANQQIVFQNSFESDDAFEEWMEKASDIGTDVPWKNGGKAPSDYTWEEFEALTADQQMVFQNSFENIEKFDEWLNKVDPEENDDTEVPSENFEKPLNEYTWEEFEAMSMDEQMIFQNSFESIEEFDKWLQANEPKD